ncbi:MAG: serine/threonine-protein kinase [Nannocystaceae bacterium]
MGGLSDTEPQRSVEAQRLHDRVRGLLFGEPAAPTHLGRYEVGERLGAGGMGIVYAGYDPELGRRVAIKLVRPDRAGDLAGRSARDRLLREAQAMARLSSPHTVTVYEAGTYGDQVFVVMEFVAGMTLSQWLLRSPRSWREVQAIFLEAGRGLLAAHRAGLVHRDFKPDNVLLGDDGRARVADFGLAAAVAEAVASGAGVGVAAGRVQGADAGVVEVVAAGRAHGVDEAGEGAGAGAGRVMPDDEGSPRSRAFAERGSASGTIAGAQIGSLHYMSPEQHRGAAVDARSDQFSFCVSLWEALYGASPFPATTVDELRERVLAGAVARPLEAGRVPAALRRIALRGLQVDPARRYPDMAALLAALERVGRRRGALVIGLGAATLVGALALGLVIRRPDPRDLCDDAGAEAAAAWGDPQRAAVRRAFQGTGRADAAAVYAQVAERLDAYASEWVGARRDACRAANLAEETGASEVAHLQIACLDRGLGELRRWSTPSSATPTSSSATRSRRR